MKRQQYAAIICERMEKEAPRLRRDFVEPGRIQSCYIDDLLPQDAVREIHAAFPARQEMMLKKSLREFKHVAAQMNKYNPLLEEIVYAFQDPRVVELVGQITGIRDMVPDHNLYAGGISLMAKGNFLNPHLDNSHDKDRDMYRVLNLLYYVTPGWQAQYGGNLELWDNGPESKQREIESKFNRLAMMATHEKSWHSVNEVKYDGNRCCVSNYFFSKQPLEGHEYFHVTSFRGRPNQSVRDMVLKTDVAARMTVRKLFKKGIKKNPHVYRKPT